MLSARRTFADRLDAFRSAVAEPVSIDSAPSQLAHNARARILRNGLAVVAFAMLEDFVKSRTAEVLKKVGTGATPFDDLPDKLRHAATNGVVRGLGFQGKFLDSTSSDYYDFFRQHSASIASTSRRRFSISALAFAHDKSNIEEDQITAILSAFKIAGGWTSMEAVAARSNATVLSMKSAFKEAAKRRHEAAHRASASVPTADLLAFSNNSVGMALSFDLLLSRALLLLRRADAAYLLPNGRVADADVLVRLVVNTGGMWTENDPLTGGTFQQRSLRRLLPAAQRRAKAAEDSVVVIGTSGRPTAWYTPFVD